MWLSELEALRLRNLSDVRLVLGPGLTVISGRNGQGKTGLLEAVYLLGTGRSFRTRRTDELVSWDGGPARTAGVVERQGGRTKLAVVIEHGGRRLLVENGERELGDFLGRLDVIDLTAERMKVLRGGPEERRKFLDRGVVGIKSGYLVSLGRYRRALQQRNALLRGGSGALTRVPGNELEVWDGRVAAAAVDVHRERREYLAALQRKLASAALFGGRAGLELRYQPSPVSVENVPAAELERAFRLELERGRARDAAIGHTGAGPHRDELVVELNGVDLRRFGSAGQVRGAMVALKLAKLELLRDERGETPVFLMDDFDTELDEERAAALAQHLHRERFQALVATSKESMASDLGVECDRVVMERGHAARARG